MSRRTRLLVPLFLVLGALLIAEGGARILAKRAWRPLPPFGVGAIQEEWLAEIEGERSEDEARGYSRFDAALGWSPEPGYVSPDGDVHVNSRGLRALREFAAVAPPPIGRVLAFGESFTFGEEVSDAEAWCARLEILGSDREHPLEVLNYGVGGYGTDQALLRATMEARGPVEALLVGLMLENIGRNVNRYRPLWYPQALPAAKPRFVVEGPGLRRVDQPFATRADFVEAVRAGTVMERLSEDEYWSPSPLPSWSHVSMMARLFAGRRAYAARELEPLFADVEGEPFATTVALLEAFQRMAAVLPAEHLLVLVFPPEEALQAYLESGQRYWSTLLTALEARGISFLDLSEPLAAEARKGGVGPLYLLSHFSPRANDLVARAIAERLAQERAAAQPK